MKLLLSRPLSVRGLQCLMTACAANPPEGIEISFGSHDDISDVAFQLPSGNLLSEPTAICKYLACIGQKSLLPLSVSDQNLCDELIARTERNILPFIDQGDKVLPALLDAVESFDKILASSHHFLGNTLSVADLMIWASFYHLFYIGGHLKDTLSSSKNLNVWFQHWLQVPWIQHVLKIFQVKSPSNNSESLETDVAWKPKVGPGHTVYSWGKPSITIEKEETKKSEKKKRGIRLPIKGKRNILITSALPYVNNVPHLGNLIGCVLSADVYYRFCNIRGHNAIYICGTDEYGTATEFKAIECKTTPQKICDKYFAIHRDIYKWFNIDFSIFGRTTTWQQTAIAQDIFWNNDKHENTFPQNLTQLWCKKFGFLADRFIVGKCPKCGADDATGDQCDACGSMLNPTELIDPRCKLDKTVPVEEKKSNHLYLDLPKLVPELTKWIDKSSKKGKWSTNSIDTTMKWIRDGLKPRCITRDLKWGTPVPKKGFEDKVFYVWFDAPIGYISITANYTEDWKQWWKNPEDVELYQFMGKDNVPFHCIIFPSTLMGTGEKWTLLHHINTTEYLNYEGGKFSKSRGVGVFGSDAQSTGIPSEIWRYYLLVNRPEGSDTMFNWDDFADKNNKELLANLGNFINRALKFCSAKFDGVVPNYNTRTSDDEKFIAEVLGKCKKYIETLEAVKLKDGLKVAMSISQTGNKYMQDNAPWVLFKKDKDRCGTVIGLCVNLVFLLSILIEPYMPALSKKIGKQLNSTFGDGILIDEFKFPSHIRSGHKIGTPTVLVREISDKEVESLREKFSEADKGPVFVLDLKCGVIKEAELHPNADKLYVLKVDLGEKLPRTIVSGLREHYQQDELKGKTVVVLTNAKHRKIMGVKSEGMILTGIKNNVLGILTAKTPVKPGSQAKPEGSNVMPQKNFDIRKNLPKLKLTTGSGGVCLFKDLKFIVDGTDINIFADKVDKGAEIK